MKRRRHNLPIAALAFALLSGPFACGDNLTLPPERPAYEPAEVEPLTCVPNLDARIEASELRAGIGVPVTYRISPVGETRQPNLAGATDSDGVVVWDWSEDHASDQSLEVEAEALSDKWYADAFEGGAFVTDLEAGGRLVGVYSQTDDAILLHGYASREEAPDEGKTLVVYEAPVVIYELPIVPDAEWVSTGTIRNATIRGLPYAGRDIYEFRVAEVGELWLPDLRFEQVFQIRSDITVEPAVGEAVTRKQVSYLFECFGEVARAVSRDGETAENFTAVEMRRLSLGRTASSGAANQ